MAAWSTPKWAAPRLGSRGQEPFWILGFYGQGEQWKVISGRELNVQ